MPGGSNLVRKLCNKSPIELMRPISAWRDCVGAGRSPFFQNLKDRQAGKTTRKVGPPTFRKIAKAKSFTLTQQGGNCLVGIGCVSVPPHTNLPSPGRSKAPCETGYAS